VRFEDVRVEVPRQKNLAAHCPVLTGNGRHFSDIPDLRVLSPAEMLALLNLRGT
jgi:hypothetical protein